ncbi:hypothetical protein H1C71_041134 [Ictidomys tridecemlineatus]|nr:hypothetical protein H1C71_041134 [Ictidomys tridecemlineatus]
MERLKQRGCFLQGDLIVPSSLSQDLEGHFVFKGQIEPLELNTFSFSCKTKVCLDLFCPGIVESTVPGLPRRSSSNRALWVSDAKSPPSLCAAPTSAFLDSVNKAGLAP